MLLEGGFSESERIIVHDHGTVFSEDVYKRQAYKIVDLLGDAAE